MNLIYKPAQVCAKEIIFKVEDNTLTHIDIIGGCPGNLIGLKQLITGMKIEEVIEKLDGITCGQRSTSCPDQIATMLKEYLKKQAA